MAALLTDEVTRNPDTHLALAKIVDRLHTAGMNTTGLVAQDDAVITASIKALAAARDMSLDAVAVQVSMTPRTLYRRIKVGRWTAGEVSRFARLFGVSRESIYTGIVNVAPPPGPESGTAVGRMGVEPMRGGVWVTQRDYATAA